MKENSRGLFGHDLENLAEKLKIDNFRGVFTKDLLPDKPRRKETLIINLDTILGYGTHWVATRKSGFRVIYFDSYGNIPPPVEVVRYFKGCEILYNGSTFQNFNTTNCGELCLEFLHNTRDFK